MRYFRFIFFSALFFCTHFLFAQNQATLLNVDYKNAAVADLVNDLESKTVMRFYYNPRDTDSIRVTLKADQKPITFILEEAFKNSNLHFAIDGTSIFLTKDAPINTNLAAQFFKQNQTDKELKSETNLIVDSKQSNASTEYKVYEIGIKTNEIQSGTATLVGYLRDFKTGEPIDGASIMSVQNKIGVFSDKLGFYSITLPKGTHTLQIKAANLTSSNRQIVLYSDGILNIELKEKVLNLKTVDILAQRNSNLKRVEMGVNKLDIKSIKQVPSVFGEPDILRVVLTLPGVQSVGEASTGFNVRGGAADQNLILLDDATIYNPSHFFGFFSSFNPEIVSDVQLYKSYVPEKFGGRLSSVLEVKNRVGNKTKFAGSAGIGLITSRLNIEGPIDSGKTSFILGARTTYSNWLLKLLPKDYSNSKASFADVNLGINHKINDKNELILSTYFSNDQFSLNSDTTYAYGNKNASVKWKHAFNSKLTSSFVGGFDKYDYRIKSGSNEINAYDLKSSIGQANLKVDFTYIKNEKHTLNFGFSTIFYSLQPAAYMPLGSQSIVIPNIVPNEQALESGIYLGDKFDVTKDFTINAGLRFSMYSFLGPNDKRTYVANEPRSEASLLNTTSYSKNKVIASYSKPEIRISTRYNITEDFSVKAAYNTLQQYIHLISNTTAIAPTDIYKLSDPNIKPQSGSQVSLGLYKNYNDNVLETSVEVYYKQITDYLDYKSGADLVLNKHLETDVINTKGKAYGIEFFIRKNIGRLNGWMSYAYSRTLLKDDDALAVNKINDGNFYPANFDKPHAFNFIGNYRFTQRVSFSLNLTYSTGRPITLPIAKYFYAGSQRVYYSDRNAYRIPDYFRTDLSFNVEGNHKVKQRTHGSWTVGLYNVTGRKNAFSTYFTQQKGVIQGYKLSIFATALPFVNYNVRF